jgi:hypothetical protein
MEDSAAIRREIEAARARIAETATALAYRADVKARVNDELAHRIAGARASIAAIAKSFSGEPENEPKAPAAGRNVIVFAVGSFAATLLLWLFFASRRRDESQDRDAA